MSISQTLTETDCRRATRGGSFRLPILVSLLLCAGAFALSPNYRWSDQFGDSPFAGDFLQEWIGGRIVTGGDHSRFYDVSYAQSLEHDAQQVGFRWSRHSYFPMAYPPFYYLLVAPLSFLSYRLAAWIWATLMVGCFAAAVHLMWRSPARELRPAGLNAKQLTPWLIPVAVLFAPMLENLTTGQKGTVCLLILTATFCLLQRQRPFWAGVVFGLIAFKPQFAIPIAVAMLLKRQWSFVAGGLTTGTLLVGLSLLLGGDVCGQYVQFATGAADYIHTGGYDLHSSHCLYGFFTLLGGGEMTPLVQLSTLVTGFIVIVLLARTLRGPLNTARPDFAIQFSALIVATLLLSPHLFTYDLTILLLPMFLIGRAVHRGDMPHCRHVIIGLLAALYILPGVSPTIAASIGIQMTTLGMLLLIALTFSRSTRS